jgi:hypothetical protein
LKNEKKGLDDDRQALFKTRAKLELEMRDLQSSVNKATENEMSAQEKLQNLDAEIEAKERELAQAIGPQYDEVLHHVFPAHFIRLISMSRHCTVSLRPPKSCNPLIAAAGT